MLAPTLEAPQTGSGFGPDVGVADYREALRQIAHGLLSLESSHEEIQAARQDFSSLINSLARDEFDMPLRQDEYSAVLDDAMVTCRALGIHLSVMAFPGLGKSTRGAWFLISEMARNLAICTVQVAAVSDPAAARTKACRMIVESSAFRERFPDVIPDTRANAEYGESTMGWSQDAWYLKNRGQQVWPSMDSSECVTLMESRRVDIMLGDDIMTRRVALSDTMREDNIDSFKKTWLEGRCALHGWILLFQNCWHEEDLAHVLREDTRFCSMWTGITETFDGLFVRLWNPPPDLGIILNPDEFNAVEVEAKDGATLEFHIPLPSSPSFTEEVLRDKYENDESTFRQVHWLEALSDESRMFPAWGKVTRHPGTVVEMLGEGFSEMEGMITANDVGRRRYALAVGVDISGLRRAGTAITLLGKDASGKIHPIEMHLGKYSNSDIVRILDSMWKRGLQFSVVMVENNGVQDQIEESIRAMAKGKYAEWSYRVKGFTTGSNKADPTDGLPGINTEMENGGHVWPDEESGRRDVAHSKHWISLETAFASCPRIIKAGKTSDILMAYWFARNALIGVSVGGGRKKRKRKSRGTLRSTMDKF